MISQTVMCADHQYINEYAMADNNNGIEYKWCLGSQLSLVSPFSFKVVLLLFADIIYKSLGVLSSNNDPTQQLSVKRRWVIFEGGHISGDYGN